MSIPDLACMAFVAAIYHLPPRVLPSIQAVEGGHVGMVSVNADGSEDLGLMQVNTLWIPTLSRAMRLSEATVRDRLVSDSCFNIAAAGAILRHYMNESGGDLMRAIGNYHSHTPTLNASYLVRVTDAARRLFEAGGHPSGR